MADDLRNLEEKIAKARPDKEDMSAEERQYAARSTGMRAGSEFMAYILSGGIAGWIIGHFFGNMPLWIILMVFLGFGMGIHRAAQLMK